MIKNCICKDQIELQLNEKNAQMKKDMRIYICIYIYIYIYI
jgi:hypothetical protein